MGEALALDAAWLFAAFLILLILAASGIAVRRFLLERGGATVECGLRRPGGSWRLGLASSSRTLTLESADSRAASAQPALPAPTMM